MNNSTTYICSKEFCSIPSTSWRKLKLSIVYSTDVNARLSMLRSSNLLLNVNLQALYYRKLTPKVLSWICSHVLQFRKPNFQFPRLRRTFQQKFLNMIDINAGSCLFHKLYRISNVRRSPVFHTWTTSVVYLCGLSVIHFIAYFSKCFNCPAEKNYLIFNFCATNHTLIHGLILRRIVRRKLL